MSACLIVRDGAATIERCLASIRPHVDEVCIFDTGSTDGTLEILERLSAEPGSPIIVQRGEWRDDFAWARNESFAMASSDFLMWLDDDDVVEGGEHLRGLLTPEVDALWVLYRYAPGSSDWAFRVRVVRAALKPFWEYPVHEEIVPSSVGETWRREAADPSLMKIAHLPVSQAGRHDYRALIERHAQDSRVMRYYLGREVFRAGGFQRAAEIFEEVVDQRRPWLEREIGYVARAYLTLAFCRARLGDPKGSAAALRWRERVLQRRMRDPFNRRLLELGKDAA